jgi:hypothetical protein
VKILPSIKIRDKAPHDNLDPSSDPNTAVYNVTEPNWIPSCRRNTLKNLHKMTEQALVSRGPGDFQNRCRHSVFAAALKTKMIFQARCDCT